MPYGDNLIEWISLIAYNKIGEWSNKQFRMTIFNCLFDNSDNASNKRIQIFSLHKNIRNNAETDFHITVE